jgi:hypothetical protein
MKRLYLSIVTFSILTSFNKHQKVETYFYRPDLGIYFQHDKNIEKQKVPFKENWDFYFSLKNDSTAVIQEIKNKRTLEPKEHKISLTKDSTFVKRQGMNGKIYKVEKMYFRKIYI